MTSQTQIWTRKQLTNILKKDVVLLTFIKADSVIKMMTCTLCLDNIPPADWPVGGIERLIDSTEKIDEFILVYDLELGCWRGFYVDRVTGVKIV